MSYYNVICGGAEVTRYPHTKEEAMKTAKFYEEEGYEDVVIRQVKTPEKTVGDVIKFKLEYMALMLNCNRVEQAEELLRQTIKLCSQATTTYKEAK
tara:strand:- start:217 stop:504 length:288 start_codon:yes stop_codon:yes gene_type:complete